MDLLRPVRAYDRFQQRHAWLAIPMAVLRKFGNDQAGSLASLIAYYAFFSIFPLLLAFVTILGFVLQGDTNAQNSITNSVLGQFPVVGQKLDPHALRGSVPALVIGLLVSLWSGLGVTQAAQNAFDRVWAVPFKDRPNFIFSRLRGLALLVSLGLLFIVATLASGLVIGGLGGPLVKVAGIVISLLVNFCLFGAAFRFMTASTVRTRDLWLGVVVAGVAWEILQIVGGYYIGHVLKNDSKNYAQFAFVLALLVWLHLGAQITVYACEINVVVLRHLWPRSLFGPPAVPADEETLTRLAKVEERHQEQKVEVEFEQDRAGS
ncbi:MAG: YihY/virulence factor BrkB family protein [Solirubrobacterales bacterium]|nr:YihY/virulence factor BrkB family protein [Solirubrobacterales bacterium]MBV9049787.1 YihY/virulence factor BrkB family protein [Solirubrobacterales bacterium]